MQQGHEVDDALAVNIQVANGKEITFKNYNNTKITDNIDNLRNREMTKMRIVIHIA